jgi:hypothetical protein
LAGYSGEVVESTVTAGVTCSVTAEVTGTGTFAAEIVDVKDWLLTKVPGTFATVTNVTITFAAADVTDILVAKVTGTLMADVIGTLAADVTETTAADVKG